MKFKKLQKTFAACKKAYVSDFHVEQELQSLPKQRWK
jgi:hypothetical protein